MMRTGVWGMALAAAGFFIAALTGPLALFGWSPSLTLTETDPALTMPTFGLLEFLGFTVVLAGTLLLMWHVRGTFGMLDKPVLAGLFLLSVGAALRVLFYLLTFLSADSLAQDQAVLDEWNRTWYVGAVAAAAGVVFLTAALAPVRARGFLAALTGVAAAVYSAVVFLEWDVVGLRDLALGALGIGLAEVAIAVKRDPVNRFH